MGASADVAAHPVGAERVHIAGGFWEERRSVVRGATLRIQYEQCVRSGALANFVRAADAADTSPFHGEFYSDSDVYKWVEAAAWSLAGEPDEELRAKLDHVITLVERAQTPDGYLNTYFTGEREAQRWSDPSEYHELYCGGHLIYAALAHHRVTGSKQLLNVALRWADHVDREFGSERRRGADGHPGVEMALIELYRETRESRYLTLARFFLDERGRQPALISGSPYHLDHAPVRQQVVAVGHAVRALYLYCAVADLVIETNDRALHGNLSMIWDDLDAGKVYLTGGIGSRWEGESIGEAYELPNERAYCETCAAVARVMLAYRLLLFTGHSRYRDALEWTLYNAVLPGVSLEGDRFFYQNPLADNGGHRRQEWFSTACCPPNLSRMIASLPAYVFTQGGADTAAAVPAPRVCLQLPISCVAHLDVEDQQVVLTVDSDLPWRGCYEILVEPSDPLLLALILPAPAWFEQLSVQVNGARVLPDVGDGYFTVTQLWQSGDRVRVDSQMPVRVVEAHPLVAANVDRVAVTRGPLVYCVEQVDNDAPVSTLHVPPSATWRAAKRKVGALEVEVLQTEAASLVPSDSRLYRAACTGGATTATPRSTMVQAVPYFAWANRADGAMQVWMRREQRHPGRSADEAARARAHQ